MVEIGEQTSLYRRRVFWLGLLLGTGLTGGAVTLLSGRTTTTAINHSSISSSYTSNERLKPVSTDEILSRRLGEDDVYAAADDDTYKNKNNDDHQQDAADDGGADKGANNAEDEHDKHGLEFDDLVYIDDDYIDDYYAYEVDPRRPKLFPVSNSDVFGFLFASMGVTLAAGGGIGGGGIAVPIYIIVMGLSPRDAIPIASVTVFGGAIGSLLVNHAKRHPLADRPLIDWNLVLVMEPLILTGALVGTLLHRVLGEKLLVVLLVALLSVTAHTTLAKAKRMWDAESRYIERLREFHRRHGSTVKKSPWRHPKYHPPDLPSPIPIPVPLPEGAAKILPSVSEGGGKPILHTSQEVAIVTTAATEDDNASSSSTDECDPLAEGAPKEKKHHEEIIILNPDYVSLRSDMLEEEKVTPRNKIIALMCMFSILIFLNLMVGGGAFESPWGIECGSFSFWVVHVIMGAFLVASAWAAQTYLMNRHEIKELVSFNYVHGDIRWDARGAIVYPPIFVAAGLFAGIFGIGGGMISVPLLLTMGVHPQVATATSSCMILFTAASSVTSFAIFDLILWDYAAVCLLIGFFPTLLGQSLMRHARGVDGNFERNSIIAYCIGGVVLLSALLMTIQYVFSIVKYDADEGDEGGMCEGYRRSV